MKVNFICNTDGRGLWSNTDKPVKISSIKLAYLNEESDFGELRASFPQKSWDTDRYGLIYTDKQWMKEFRDQLVGIGFSAKAVKEVSYSEQGMQGDEYVSMDVGQHFINEFFTLGGKI